MSSIVEIAKRILLNDRREVEPGEESIGQLFRTARICAKLSLRDMCDRTGLDALTIAEYERGVRRPRSWRKLFEKLTPRSDIRLTGEICRVDDSERQSFLIILTALVTRLQKVEGTSSVVLDGRELEHARHKTIERADVGDFTQAIRFSAH